MKIPFKDAVQLSQDHSQIWPKDLIEDLEEEDPNVSLDSQALHKLISEHLKKTENSSFENELSYSNLPTLVVQGWDNQYIKGTKNWADFENLLLFYTIGELDVVNTPENQEQKKRDLTELREAIEAFLPLKGQKKKSAEARVDVNTTYLAFGKRVIDSLVNNDYSSQYELQREIQDAQETNYFNAIKLEKSYNIASRVFNRLKQRYQRN